MNYRSTFDAEKANMNKNIYINLYQTANLRVSSATKKKIICSELDRLLYVPHVSLTKKATHFGSQTNRSCGWPIKYFGCNRTSERAKLCSRRRFDLLRGRARKPTTLLCARQATGSQRPNEEDEVLK